MKGHTYNVMYMHAGGESLGTRLDNFHGMLNFTNFVAKVES